MQTGSLINLITSNTKNPTPTVGMGATILGWTDRSPATVVDVSKSGKSVTVQLDNYQRIDTNGMSECQIYKFSPNPEGSKRTFTIRKNGRWIEEGAGMNSGNCLSIGKRDRYYDYSF